MLNRKRVAFAAAIGVCVLAPATTWAEPVRSGYAPVNGLEMYYEIHGAGRPLQAHGRTADVDRPLSYQQMADDTVALLRHLGIQEADIFGYSMGGGIALEIAIRQPELVRRLVIAASSYHPGGSYPEVIEGIRDLKPEDFAGSPWLEAYLRVAPNPDDWPALVDKVVQLVGDFQGWPADAIRPIEAPALVIIGDSDIVRPEHAVELFRLLGGGVPADLHGLPRSRLAVLPGTTHVTLVERAEWLTSMVTEFLDAPMPQAE